MDVAGISAVPTVTVRFWAGARRAAGLGQEALSARTVGTLRASLAERNELRAVMAVAAMLVDGQASTDATPLPDGATVDVLPPFAGG